MAERTVYILLTRSGTWFSRLIHLATQDSYTHASIGLDGPGGPFYSFARKYRHLALPAGLVEEAPAVCRAQEMPCRLYALTGGRLPAAPAAACTHVRPEGTLPL